MAQHAVSSAGTDVASPSYRAFVMLRTLFTVAPILFGVDKFFNLMVDWPIYLAPFFTDVLPWSAQTIMYIVGVIEIVAGIAVAVAPRFGGYLVAAWLAGIIVNLVGQGEYWDIALRDFGLLVSALALAQLATTYAPGIGRR